MLISRERNGLKQRMKQMIKKDLRGSVNCYFVILLFTAVSCDFIAVMEGAGTHGSLGGYSYDVSKDSLESAIKWTIDDDVNITELEIDGGEGTYMKILIDGDAQYYFVYRFYGNEDEWALSINKSRIFITSFRVGEGGFKNEREISRKDRKLANRIFNEYFIESLKDHSGLVPVVSSLSAGEPWNLTSKPSL